MTYQSTARADARALAIGLATGAAVGLILGGAYVAGGLASATDAQARTARAQRVAPVAEMVLLATPVQPAALRPSQPLPVIRAATAPAAPFRLAQNSGRDLDCLADAVYYEARGETAAGQAAIAQVVLNRVRHPAFPKSVCGVVFQGVAMGACQFSFACNGAMDRRKDGQAWARAEQIAARALTGFVMPQVGEATHFHAASASAGWPGLTRVAQIGLHVFYRFGGHAGAPSVFDGRPQPSAPAADAPRMVYASMMPSLGVGATAGVSDSVAPTAPAPAPVATAATTVAATPAVQPAAKSEPAAPAKPAEVATAS